MRLRTTLLITGLVLAVGCSKDETSGTAPATTASSPADAPQDAASPAQEQVFSQEELDQMVAPIALYPDPLLAQVLMAATYPGNVADAAAWSKAHPDAQGDAAVRQVADQPWDPSVQSLVAFPQALATLGQDPAWVQRLGDAFLAQPDAVMDSVQRLRRQAQAAGNLESNEYQKVTTLPPADAAAPATDTAPAATGAADYEAAPQQAIVIEPAQPDVVYVPSYDPTAVYGTWAYPSYPPVYYPPPSAYYPVGTALASGLAFGVGLAITDSLWGGFGWDDWGHHDHVDVDIDVNRYNRINVNNRIDANNNHWQHNPAHRDGVPYRDRANREAHGRGLDGADRRAEFRGEDANRTQAREKARSSMASHGIEAAPARSNTEARERAQAATRDQARERAQNVDRDQARQRAQNVDRDQARAKAGAVAERNPKAADHARTAAQNRPAAANKVHQTQSNNNARTAARKQATPQRQSAPHNDAFQGASKPAASRAAAQRGSASHTASRQHASASRPAGKPVSRPSHPPQRHARR